jgi:hypothetical protein
MDNALKTTVTVAHTVMQNQGSESTAASTM